MGVLAHADQQVDRVVDVEHVGRLDVAVRVAARHRYPADGDTSSRVLAGIDSAARKDLPLRRDAEFACDLFAPAYELAVGAHRRVTDLDGRPLSETGHVSLRTDVGGVGRDRDVEVAGHAGGLTVGRGGRRSTEETSLFLDVADEQDRSRGALLEPTRDHDLDRERDSVVYRGTRVARASASTQALELALPAEGRADLDAASLDRLGRGRPDVDREHLDLGRLPALGILHQVDQARSDRAVDLLPRGREQHHLGANQVAGIEASQQVEEQEAFRTDRRDETTDLIHVADDREGRLVAGTVDATDHVTHAVHIDLVDVGRELFDERFADQILVPRNSGDAGELTHQLDEPPIGLSLCQNDLLLAHYEGF